MFPIKIGGHLILQVVRKIDERLAERSVTNARLAVAANESRASWIQAADPQSEPVVAPPRSA